VVDLSVSVIIPALNEEESIAQVLAEVPARSVDEILVVDGGSTDHTVAIAQEAGARVIHEPRRGYGRACATGLAGAQGEIVVFVDGDGADDPAQIPELLAPVLGGRAEMALGSRLAGQVAAGAMPAHQRFGNWLSAGLIRLLYGLPLTDLSPFRAVVRRSLLDLDMREMTYGWPTEMIVKAAQRHWRVVELPARYRPRIGGRSKISGTLKGTVLATYYILWTILRYAVRRETGRVDAVPPERVEG
jgi:glycosyltransferase involved in cell wall biosynthesis